MRYIESLRDGERIAEVYLCRQKQTMTAKNGKPYDSLLLQDKTGSLDAKIWDINSNGIEEYDALDYVYVVGDVSMYMGKLQLSIKRLQRMNPDDYNQADYLPVSRFDIDKMHEMLLKYVDKVENPYLRKLCENYFRDDNFAKNFKKHSAAKSVHHGFVGGLLEHTIHVVQICNCYAMLYPNLNKDLLLTAAMFHDIGKLQELSPFPSNDYTDAGQLLGHIMIGAFEVSKAIEKIDGFPENLKNELLHCILAHHGELEYGSPKKPALAEAVALSFADNSDAKLETFREAVENVDENNLEWQGFNRFLDSNIRRTSK